MRPVIGDTFKCRPCHARWRRLIQAGVVLHQRLAIDFANPRRSLRRRMRSRRCHAAVDFGRGRRSGLGFRLGFAEGKMSSLWRLICIPGTPRNSKALQRLRL